MRRASGGSHALPLFYERTLNMGCLVFLLLCIIGFALLAKLALSLGYSTGAASANGAWHSVGNGDDDDDLTEDEIWLLLDDIDDDRPS